MPEATSNHTIVSTRRRFLSQAASVTAGGAVLALAAMPPASAATAPASPLDPAFALIARHRAEQQAYGDAIKARDELYEIIPKEIQRGAQVQCGMKGGEPHYLYSHDHINYIMDLLPDFASTPEIQARLHAAFDRDESELSTKRDEYGATAADDRVDQLCDSCQDLSWALANTIPTSIAGVAALLRYANEFEDHGEEWPDTDTIGSDGWHYQLRQSATKALETILTVTLVRDCQDLSA
jgi:hypothetical protein